MNQEPANSNGPQGPADPSGPQGPASPEPAGGSWDLLEGSPHRNDGSGRPPGGEPTGGGVPWSTRDVFIVIGLIIVIFIATFVSLGLILAFFGASPSSNGSGGTSESAPVVTLLLIVQWVILLAVPLTYFRMRNYRLSAYILGFRRTAAVRAFLWLLLALVVSSFVEQVYGVLIERFFGQNQLPSQVPSQDVTSLFGTGAAAFIMTFIIVALLTPVVEELFFRGIVHRGLEQGLGFLPGALLSSTIFALAHVDYRLFVPIFALGFGFAFVVHKTGSIWPSIAGHFIINSVGVIAQFLDLGNGP